VKLYDPSIGPLVHHTGSPTIAGDLHPPPLSVRRGTPLSGPPRPQLPPPRASPSHPETPRLPPRHPPSPQPVEHRPPSPPVRTRCPPNRRAPPSALSPTKLGTGKASPHFCDAHARPSGPCSLAPHRDREHPDMAAVIHRRRSCSIACLGAHHPPVNSVGQVGHIGPDHLRPNPRRRREHAGQTPRPPS
jgi:hypothetical protein